MKEPMKDSVMENFYQLDHETKADYLYLYLVEGTTQDETAKNSMYGRGANTGYDVSACMDTDTVDLIVKNIEKGGI